MKQKRKVIPLLILLLALTAITIGATAQQSAGFDLSWHLIAGGGGSSSSTNFVVRGAAGQAAAGPPSLSSTGFTINSGYWLGNSRVQVQIYLPMMAGQ